MYPEEMGVLTGRCLNRCVYVFMYVYMHVCVYVYMHVLHTVCVCVCVCVYIYNIHLHVYVTGDEHDIPSNCLGSLPGTPCVRAS